MLYMSIFALYVLVCMHVHCTVTVHLYISVLHVCWFVQVNGVAVKSKTQSEVAALLRSSSEQVKLVVSRQETVEMLEVRKKRNERERERERE